MAQTNTFQTVPRDVKARRLWIDQRIEINGRMVNAIAGMWVVEAVGGKGDRLLMPDDIFRLGFRPTDSASEQEWYETTNNLWPVWPDGKPIPLH
jgi:hypothetical protein